MASHKYSYSRLGCFNDCKRKYFLKYVEGWSVEKGTQVMSDVTAKGLAIHSIFENYEPTWDETRILAEIAKYEEMYKEGKAYFPLEPKVRKFIDFYADKVKPHLEKGQVKKETWLEGEVAGEQFCGAIDLLVEHGDGTADIVDYKSAKTPTASNYRGQLLLYVYMYAKMTGIPIEGIEKKVGISVFFPFSAGETAKECLKTIRYKSEEVLANVAKIEAELAEIRGADWEKDKDPLEVTLKNTCSWCEFCGHGDFCPITYKAGLRLPRGVKFVQKKY